ncbi:OmpH family outer membrane protein [Aureispira sp. CCB-QB1]|uniref:OmpH family outer membrane protein n=1 Tax=Aureispira sp. CCB-QB1 TaxID=1313421 RepID=UPI0006974C17|nr:OmpH family outer membrane protein [Aureispira sp. CCB-QB1]
MKSRFLLPFLTTITVLSWIVIIWLIFSVNKQPKIAYVKSIYLVENYNGTKEAYQVLQKKVVGWQSNLDSLKHTYEITIDRYNQEKSTLRKEALNSLEQELMLKRQNLENYQAIVQQKQLEEDKKLTEGVYAQIDSYLKTYAKEKGYDLVIGANAEGTVLYGSNSFDITEEILAIINQKYSGNK